MDQCTIVAFDYRGHGMIMLFGRVASVIGCVCAPLSLSLSHTHICLRAGWSHSSDDSDLSADTLVNDTLLVIQHVMSTRYPQQAPSCYIIGHRYPPRCVRTRE